MKPRHAIGTLALITLVSVAVVYALSAYAFVPSLWRFVERRHPALDSAGTRAFTAAGIPGDPLNISFVGTEADLQRVMTTGHWVDADPVTMRSSVRIVVDSAARRGYESAPVSTLYVQGRRQDVAFEAPAGKDPASRHHVRFWRMPQTDLLGRVLWVGAATFDRGVGLSHTTGQVTHHIAPNVDAERDKLLSDVAGVPGLQLQWIDAFQTTLQGKNGGGDPYYTDGRMAVLSIDPAVQ